MIMPFPGMDPYLEHPLLWPTVHNPMITFMAQQLSPRLRPRYIVSVEQRVFLLEPEAGSDERVPDLMIQKTRDNGSAPVATMPTTSPVLVEGPFWEQRGDEIRESFLAIQDRYQDYRTVTVVELLSPSNKKTGAPRQLYLLKQRQILESDCHLVEIDLLRRGRPTLCIAKDKVQEKGPFDYLICVNRAGDERQRFELYPCPLRQRLPVLNVPLTASDPDVPLDLQTALEQAYDIGSFMLKVRYDEPCDPPLEPVDQEWASACWQAYKAARQDLFGAPTPVADGTGGRR